jgi:hypothetical protein
VGSLREWRASETPHPARALEDKKAPGPLGATFVTRPFPPRAECPILPTNVYDATVFRRLGGSLAVWPAAPAPSKGRRDRHHGRGSENAIPARDQRDVVALAHSLPPSKVLMHSKGERTFGGPYMPIEW